MSSTLLQKIRVNKSYPFVGRAAGRSITGTLGFLISNIVASEIRKRTTGVPVEDAGLSPSKVDALLAKYGNTVDARNEQDEASRGAAHLDKLREEQGLVVNADPMELAGKLNIIRLSIAEDLLANAQMMVNPLDPKGSTYPNPYDVAPSLDESFERQVSQQPRINEVQLKAQAAALNLPYEDVLRVTRARQEAGVRFLKAHKEEILSMLATLGASDSQGNQLSTDDAESVELGLPPIQRARLYVAADRGLWYERDRAIGLYMRGHPDGEGNIKIVDGTREEIHADFNRLMRTDSWKRSIEDAVARGAQYPVLLALPSKATTAKLATAAKAA